MGAWRMVTSRCSSRSSFAAGVAAAPALAAQAKQRDEGGQSSAEHGGRC